MTTRMVHPLHGATHAYDAGEIARLEGLGWSVEVPAVMGGFSGGKNGRPVPPVVTFYEAPPPFAPARKKPGPKHKAK